jgi:hypothetical protein
VQQAARMATLKNMLSDTALRQQLAPLQIQQQQNTLRCDAKPAYPDKTDTIDTATRLNPNNFFVCKPPRRIRLRVSPAPSSGCEMTVPVARQSASGSGHKGSRSLRTRGKGPWHWAVEFGEMRALCEHSPQCATVRQSDEYRTHRYSTDLSS